MTMIKEQKLLENGINKKSTCIQIYFGFKEKKEKKYEEKAKKDRKKKKRRTNGF